MAVNELDVTVVGWVGNVPLYHQGEGGQVAFTRFRLASTPRVYDRARDAYVDGVTSWFTVKAFRHLAVHVAESLRRGDPVLVHGRLAMVEWTAPDGSTRTTAEITADSVGHDLARGSTRFKRTVREGRPEDGEGPGAGVAGVGGEGGPAPVPVDLTGVVVLEDDPAGDVRAAA